MRIRWTKTAKGHLRGIHDYIAKDSAQYAKGMIDRLTRRVGILASMPEVGPVVQEYNEQSIRELFEHPYRIIYKVFAKQIDILAVVHSARLLPDQPSKS
ncbi:MAG TPA: type II toxin-antitoxin system RelE/ParE family toxin [Gemmataceae bacterium]|jgi:plasmid stabilization system protein ParE|nr:type II toxin-antitoxin system RelE/ParE family toxin [Gemmataceae bacterium]